MFESIETIRKFKLIDSEEFLHNQLLAHKSVLRGYRVHY